MFKPTIEMVYRMRDFEHQKITGILNNEAKRVTLFTSHSRMNHPKQQEFRCEGYQIIVKTNPKVRIK